MLGIVTAVLAVGLCEILIRLTHPAWSQQPLGISSEITHHPVQGWTGRPGFTGRVGPNQTDIRINPQGYRDDDFDEKLRRAAAEGRSRILFIGDSLTYGYRLPESDRLSEQVAEVAAARGSGIETFNAGIPGYGTGQEYRAMEQLLPALRPQVVVLWYCSNDVGDSALPYDYRLDHRVYKPFYDLDGRLIHHRKVPVRLSYRMRGTWVGGWKTWQFIDRLRYRWEDRRYAPDVYLLGSPRVSEEPVMTAKERSLFLRNLGAMALIPELRPFFDINLERNLALWSRMRDLCRANGARFIMLFDPNDEAQTTPRVMQRVAGQGIEVIAYGDRFDPYRPWGGVWGDGHPNAVQNYVGALAVVDGLDQTDSTVDFSRAPWIDTIPGHLDLARDASRRLLNGVWGTFGKAGREAGTQAYCMLCPPPAGAPIELRLRGDGLGEDARIRLWCGGRRVGEFTVTAHAPFTRVAPLGDRHPGVLFVRIEAEPDVMIREIRVQPVTPAGPAGSE